MTKFGRSEEERKELVKRSGGLFDFFLRRYWDRREFEVTGNVNVDIDIGLTCLPNETLNLRTE